MLRFAALAAAAASAATAFIATPPSTAAEPTALDRCAVSYRFTRVREADEHGAIIETTPGKRFVVEFDNPCLSAKHGTFAKLRTLGGGASVCIERGDGLIFYTPGFREYRYTCRIRSIEPLLKHS